MIRWVAQLYTRRIVNVNINIILSGMLSLIPTLAAVHFSRYFGVGDDSKVWISAITFVADMLSDVVIYYVLHWLANHSPAATRRTLERAEELVKTQAIVSTETQLARSVRHPVSFLKDATMVQLERMCLSPVLYGVLLATQQYMMRVGFDRVWATTVAFLLGIAATRFLHTLWMLRQERKTRRRLQQAARDAGASGGTRPTVEVRSGLNGQHTSPSVTSDVAPAGTGAER